MSSKLSRLSESCKELCDPEIFRSDPVNGSLLEKCRSATISALRSDPRFLVVLQNARNSGAARITGWTNQLKWSEMASSFADTQLDEYPDFTPMSVGSLKQAASSFRENNAVHHIRIILEEHGFGTNIEGDLIFTVGRFVLMLCDDREGWELLLQDAGLKIDLDK